MKRIFVIFFLISCGPNLEDQITPPQDVDELHDWLVAGDYKEWTSEERVMIGENGAPRRLFVNEVLLSGLRSEVAHKVGAVSIREMYEKDEVRLRGISLMEKREVGGELKWFYYETFDLEERTHNVAKIEAPGCEFCHKAGFDSIQSSISYFESSPQQ